MFPDVSARGPGAASAGSLAWRGAAAVSKPNLSAAPPPPRATLTPACQQGLLRFTPPLTQVIKL